MEPSHNVLIRLKDIFLEKLLFTNLIGQFDVHAQEAGPHYHWIPTVRLASTLEWPKHLANTLELAEPSEVSHI